METLNKLMWLLPQMPDDLCGALLNFAVVGDKGTVVMTLDTGWYEDKYEEPSIVSCCFHSKESSGQEYQKFDNCMVCGEKTCYLESIPISDEISYVMLKAMIKGDGLSVWDYLCSFYESKENRERNTVEESNSN